MLKCLTQKQESHTMQEKKNTKANKSITMHPKQYQKR
jgi:hypothetical protein